MSDIVEQLRTEAEATAGRGDPTQSLLWRASDEIAWLRAELEHAQRMRLAAFKAVQDMVIAYDKAEAKRSRQERNR